MIDAVQDGDVDALCRLTGREDVPDGLARYREALDDGLTTDIASAGQAETAPGTVALRYVIGDDDATLGLAFQRQSTGWVLLMAPYLEN